MSFRGVTKRFGETVACDGVDLEVAAGEIHGLLGENGAGKSTLVKLLVGIHQPDSGRIFVDGEPHQSRDPRDAVDAGISMVHQHFSLVPTIPVWENVVLSRREKIRRDDAVERILDISARYGLEVDPSARVGELTTGQRQRVEIIKCLWSDPAILVLDEPTSVLTRSEALDLFETLRLVVTDELRSVILISHKLDEILSATDRVTVLRGGRVVAREVTSETNASDLAMAMVGRAVRSAVTAAAIGKGDDVTTSRSSADGPATGPAALSVRGLTVKRDNRTVLSVESLDVADGETLGIAGVEGNGQDVMASVLAGVTAPSSGSILVGGEPIELARPGGPARAGISVITEDRHHDGCALDLSVAENLLCDRLDSCGTGGFLSRRSMTRRALELMEEFGVRAASPWVRLRSLSGGNQQRVVIARELTRSPRVIVAAQATRGLDVGSAEFVLERLLASAAAGTAVVLISSELDEVLALADRVAVMVDGRIVGIEDAASADRNRIGLMMGGVEVP